MGGEGLVYFVLALVLGMLTGGLIMMARVDVEVVERHLEIANLLGRAFAIGAFFAMFVDSMNGRRALSLCAGGAVFAFAYWGACRLAFHLRR